MTAYPTDRGEPCSAVVYSDCAPEVRRALEAHTWRDGTTYALEDTPVGREPVYGDMDDYNETRTEAMELRIAALRVLCLSFPGETAPFFAAKLAFLGLLVKEGSVYGYLRIIHSEDAEAIGRRPGDKENER